MLSRRKFLGLATGAAAASAIGGTALWEALVRDHVHDALDPNASTTNGRVLVVLQLAGGNDGLNTLVPSVGRYRDLRPSLAVPEPQLVAVDAAGYALHSALQPLADRFNGGQIAAVQGIGLRDQSRSHFRAMDTWWAGTGGASSTTGWLGRWLDATEGSEANPLRAISLGTSTPALVGDKSIPTVVLSPNEFTLRTPRGVDAATVTAAFLATAQPHASGPMMAAAQSALPSAIDALDALAKVRESQSSNSATPQYGTETATTLLDAAAGIIELGIGTRVLFVGISGFDTHSDQAARQEALLKDVAGGIAAFFDRLERGDRVDDVLLITTSEFGRRVASNASGGTDHGAASVQFVAGHHVKGGKVVGALDLDHLVDGDVPIVVDTRSLYAVALDWLGGPSDELLDGKFDRLGLI
jgi:uncharacterized protein (DUF1501 family)